ncbi:cytochrome c oxidase assembly protein [Lutibaculum baratangense]|nr:cytochrome c oxidase assembly protein [Lutibaculum baratangense]
MRPLSLTAAILLLALAWGGPLPGMTAGSFTAHMILHVTLVAVVAPLLAMALAGTRLDPTIGGGVLFAPLTALVVEFFVVWGWHAPGPHLAARVSWAGFAAEQASFLAAGLLVWLSAIGGRSGDRQRAAGGVAALLLTSMHMTLLGALFLLAPRVLCTPPTELHALLGLSALEDQQLGGTIMLAVGGLAYLAGGLALARRLLVLPAPEPRI